MPKLFVTTNYLEEKNTKSKTFIDALSKKEQEINKLDYNEAVKYLANIGGVKAVFSDSRMKHFNPGGANDGERVIYNTVSEFKDYQVFDEVKNNSIVFFELTKAKDHDKTANIAKNVLKKINSYEYRVLDEETEDKFLFPLSENQRALVHLRGPSIVIGSAGSGKTVTAVELYKKLKKEFQFENNFKMAFITLTDSLVTKVKNELALTNFDNLDVYTFASFANIDYQKQDYYAAIIEDILNSYDPNYHKKQCKLIQRNSVLFNKYSLLTIIRGFFIGRLDAANNYNRYDFSKNKQKIINEFIKVENFKKLYDNNYSEIVDLIYEIFQKYLSYKQNNNIKDDNDFVVETKNYYDCIVVDEMQDLTEYQLSYIIKSCDCNNLFLYGDPSQIINPTFFDIDRISGLVNHFGNGAKVKISRLKDSYRSDVCLIRYINKLTDIKKACLGSMQNFWDEHEESIKKESSKNWACLLTNKECINDLMVIFNSSVDSLIVVDNDQEREALFKRYPSLESKSSVYTITEIKGLECKNIIIYNFLSTNHDIFLDILSKNFSGSTMHRNIFNRYYVALTRGIETIIICEDQELDQKIKDEFFSYTYSGVEYFVENLDENFEIIESYISTNDNPYDYLDIARLRYKEKQYHLALDKYQKAIEFGDSNFESEIEDEVNLLKDIIKIVDGEFSDFDLNQLSKIFLSSGEFYPLKLIYEKLNSEKVIIPKYFLDEISFDQFLNQASKLVIERDEEEAICQNLKFANEYTNYLRRIQNGEYK